MFVLAFTPVDYAAACEAVGTYASYMIEIDEYASLTSETCRQAGIAPYFVNEADKILAADKVYADAILLGYTEVTNAGTWMLVVVVLWIDVFLQLRGKLTDKYHRYSTYVKVLLYLILITAAVIWGIYGNFMDFWDAFIWIAAFFFIELNLMQWQEETEGTQPTNTTGEQA